MEYLFDGITGFSNGIVAAARSGTGLSFVSSAEVPGAWRFPRPLCTSLTAALLATARREFRPLVAPFGHSLDVGSGRVSLFRAGTVPGGAGIILETGGQRVIFCASAPSAPRTLPPCDIVVAVVTAARPAPEAEVFSGLVDSAKSAVRAGMVPVVRCNQFGVARPACAALSAAGLRVRVHPAVSRLNRVWRNHGYDAGQTTGFRGGRVDGVVVMPEHLARSPLESAIEHPWRIHLCRAGQRERSDQAADQLMTLPGALTFDELDAIVIQTGAGVVAVSGDGAARFAATRSGAGRHVTVVDQIRQIDLL